MSKKVSGIYSITNTISGKKYVGSSGNIRQRWRSHKSLLKSGKHHSKHLQNSWNKHGEGAFTFAIIEELEDTEKLHLLEQVWIDWEDSYNNGYNSCPLAGVVRGFKMSEESRAKLSESLKGNKNSLGKKLSEDQKTAISKRLLGNTHTKGHKRSDEHKAKISAKGRKHSDETRKKMSESGRGRVTTEETREKISATKKGRGLKLTPENKEIAVANLTRFKQERTAKKKRWGQIINDLASFSGGTTCG